MNNSVGRTCWICYATDEDDQFALWLHPCKCRGTLRNVHSECLDLWINERQKKNLTGPIKCQRCNTEYIIKYPLSFSSFIPMSLLNRLDNFIGSVGTVVVVLSIFGALFSVSYVFLLSFGALSVLQAFGYTVGSAMLREGPTVLMLIGLPFIPPCLVLVNMIPWENAIVKVVLKYILPIWSSPPPVIRKQLPTTGEHSGGTVGQVGEVAPVQQDNVQVTPPVVQQMNPQPQLNPGAAQFVWAVNLNFVRAMLLPSFAFIIGNILFESVESNWKRSLAGFVVFIVARGTFRLYLTYNNLWRQANRTIEDYPDDPTETHNVHLEDDVSVVAGIRQDNVDDPAVGCNDAITPQAELIELL